MADARTLPPARQACCACRFAIVAGGSTLHRPKTLHVPGPLTRIFSDIHYGDRASRVNRLGQLRPLLDGVTQLVLNGDTFDTRPGPDPDYTAQLRGEVSAFIGSAGIPTTLLTGNHDPDLTANHAVDLAEERVFVTHGDVVFDNIVPWSNDAPEISRLLAAEFAKLPPDILDRLDDHLALWRRVCAAIPQRHQSERNGLKYALRFASDTIWPPTRVFRVLAAWRRAPKLAAALTRRHRPLAQFILNGHTHRPGIWRTDLGVTVINTGSFCPPTGGFVVDLTASQLTVRRTESRGDEFHAGGVLAQFTLADTLT